MDTTYGVVPAVSFSISVLAHNNPVQLLFIKYFPLFDLIFTRNAWNQGTYILGPCCQQEDKSLCRFIWNSIIRLSFPSYAPRFPMTVAYGSLHIFLWLGATFHMSALSHPRKEIGGRLLMPRFEEGWGWISFEIDPAKEGSKRKFMSGGAVRLLMGTAHGLIDDSSPYMAGMGARVTGQKGHPK